jgi:alpha/beta superfamily hydrolase
VSRLATLAGPDRAALFVAVDDAAAEPRSGVVILPPFGWEEVCSYRARREWARHLAAEGRLAVRVQFPGTGDSDGNAGDPDRLGAWTRAASDAVAWVRAQPHVERVAVIGLGLGGVAGWLAAADGAPIDDLILWGAPARGSRLVRELRAFAALQASQRGRPAPEPDTDLEIAGHVLSAETLAALGAVDLTERPLPDPSARRVLLLDRDGLAPDPRLQEHLAESGVPHDVVPGPGWGRMTAEPQAATAPLTTFATVSDWLARGDDPSALAAPRADVRLAPELTARWGDGPVREAPVTIVHRGLHLAGVLCRPTDRPSAPVSLLLLNAGAIGRQGPNRLWVEVARRWAARGVTSLRLDVEGIGDADGDAADYVSDAGLYVPRLVDQVLAGAQRLEEEAPGVPIVSVGLCSGAYWGFHAALRGTSVRTVVMLNPRALFWRDELEREHGAWIVRRQVLNARTWRRIVRREVPGTRVLAWLPVAWAAAKLRLSRMVGRSRPDASTDERITEAFDRLRDAGVRVSAAFSEREPLHHELTVGGHMAQLDRWPQLQVDELPGSVHTLQSLEAQAAAHAIIDREVGRAIERAGP